MKHGFAGFEESFLDDGVKSVCGCGWKSEPLPDNIAALRAHDKHVRQSAPICSACGCEIDRDGCGCNPVDA